MGSDPTDRSVLHSYLCWCVWRRLQRPEKADQIRDVVGRWIALLLSQPRDVLRAADWGALLRGCRFPADSAVSLLLFDRVTKPRVCLKPAWHLPGFDDDEAVKVRFELNLLRDREHWAAESWTQLFKPNLAAYAPLLEAVVTANISAAHGLYTLEQKLPKDVDPFRLHRQSIEPHEQDRHPRTLDLLVDAAREILDLLIETKPQEGIALVAKWFNSGIPLLRRLAVHGYGRRTDVTPDEKLRWLLAHDLLYRFKTDVFEFLRRTYPLASETAKGEFHRIALQGPRGELHAHLEEKTRAYETFNLMVWVQRIAPDCGLVEQSLALLRRQNPEFSPRDFPDVDFWFSAAENKEPMAAFNMEEILAKPPSDFLDKLLAVRPTGPLDTSRSDYCGAVAAVTSKDPRWGIEWVRTLATRQLHDADLWHAVCQGWRNGALAPEEWRSTLGLMVEIQGPPAFFESFTDVLEHGARREQHAIPGELMPLAQKVAERVWREALEASPPQEHPHRDWLADAINHPGGKLAEFWLQRVSLARKEAGDAWKGIPPDITDRLKMILRSSSGAATHARVVFASQLHYFHSLDVPFTESEILPLLDWRAHATWAEQCWHGFLIWGRWRPGLRERLLPQFDETLSRAAEMPDHLREAVANQAASLALFGIENPLADAWIMQVVVRLPEPDLERFASKVRQFLDESEPSTAERIWTRWLHQYWRARLLGTPKPLSAGEANAMACWALSVGKHFPDAVTLVAEMGSTVTFEHTALLYWIQEKGLAEKYPDATAALVLLYLRNPKDFFPPDEHATRVWEVLKRGGLARPKLLQIRDELARLGQDPGEP